MLRSKNQNRAAMGINSSTFGLKHLCLTKHLFAT